MHFKTVNVNHDWMTTVDKKTGYGNIKKEDFTKLLKSNGFKVNDVKNIDLDYKLQKDFVDNFVKDAILNDFPELVGGEREQFFAEYIPRVEKLSKIVRNNFNWTKRIP